MIALFLKELEELLPLIVGVLVAALIWVVAHATQPLATWPVEESLAYLIEDWTFFGCLVAFAAGHSRLGPEFLYGTVAFLEGLPLSRWRIYLVKVIAGAIPVAMLMLFMLLVKAWALGSWADPQSGSVALVVVWASLHVALLFYALYGAGLFLSWFGSLGWAALGTFAGGMLFLSVLSPTARAWFPVAHGVVNLVWMDGYPATHWAPLVGWFFTGSAGIVCSGLLFLGPGDRLVQTGSAVAGFFRFLVFAAPGCLLVFVGSLSGMGLLFALPGMFEPTVRIDTEHFRILGQSRYRYEVDEMVAASEGLRAQLVERFQDPGPDRIDVEMTGSSQHYAGRAMRGKIQTAPNESPDTLAHELSHIFSQELRAERGHDDAWRFFEEGLATWVAGEVTQDEDSVTWPPDLWRREQADWALLFEDKRRSQRFDPDQVYPLGALWARAIAEAAGSPTCAVHASLQAPENLDGVPLWDAILRGCGTSLPEVARAYERLLEDAASGLPPERLDLTHATARVRREDGWIHLDVPEGVDRCRLRNDASDPREQYEDMGVEEQSCSVRRWTLTANSFEVQLGQRQVGDQLTLWGPWHTVVIPP